MDRCVGQGVPEITPDPALGRPLNFVSWMKDVRPGNRGDLTLTGVTYSYGQRSSGNVVSDVSFTVPDGEFWTLLGPSGSGKSTILRFIGGYLVPDKGKVIFDGRDITHVHPRNRDMGTVFQDYALFPHMTVFGNVAFGLNARRIAKSEVRKRVDEMLAINRLTEFVERYPHELSGGQQQRVALARALVIRPSALLMDESLSALDLKLRESMAVEIRRIQRELRTTTIHVTHDQSEAMTMSDRIVVLRGGRILQIDTPQGLGRRPATRFVAEFLGSNNVLPIVGAHEDSGAIKGSIFGTDTIRPLSAHKPSKINGEDLFLVLRSEEAKVSTSGPGINGIVRAIRYSGISRSLVIEIAAGQTMLAADPADQFSIGQNVYVSWAPEQTCVVSDDTKVA